MKEDIKVLIVEKELFHYRIPLFNLLAQRFRKVTVCHSGENVNDEVEFDQIIISRKKLGRYVFQPGLRNLANEHDVVITKFDISWLSMISLSLFRRNFKVIHWGIGVTSDKGFDVDHSRDFIRYFFAKRCDALIFYSGHPVEKYVAHNVRREKIFVAHNTIWSPLKEPENLTGEYFLFVGSLHRRKNIEELLKALAILKAEGINMPLKIVGEGIHRPILENLSTTLNLPEVEFIGAKTGPSLAEYFSKAIATVSPGQAGLSVLESMAHGVPFITKQDAITGGERLNIINNYNGFLYNGGENELSDILKLLWDDVKMRKDLQKNSYDYFTTKRRMEFMVDAFENAIKYALQN